MNRILVSITFVLLAICSYSQGLTFNLKHLTRDEYVIQIEQCADSAFAEMGIAAGQSEYGDNTYEWIVAVINKVIDDNFSSTITHNENGRSQLTYELMYYRENKSIYFGLTFLHNGHPIGETYILYGLIDEKSVQGIIKLFNCKKDIKKILGGV